MKFIHLSDLHIGKRVNEFSMIDDQIYILNQILEIIDSIKPDGVIIAGDIYDKTIPSEEAVHLLNEFIGELSERKFETYIISGNHDSAERLAFGCQLMDKSGIHISPAYNGKTVKFNLKDRYGELSLYMLPFIKPVHVRRYFPEEEINSYTDAVKAAVKHMNIDTVKRNILVTHQFVTGALRSDSEEISVGGSDNVDVSAFDCFDYVALGHIHTPQKIGRENVRYCGTPLKYSFSEEKDEKSVSVVELEEKGRVKISTIPLKGLRDMRTIKGSYMELTSKAFYEGSNTEDYIQAVLTDEEDILDAIARLRTIYPNIMSIKYDNIRTRKNSEIGKVKDVEIRSPLDIFTEFYQKQNNKPMNDEQKKLVSELIEIIWEK